MMPLTQYIAQICVGNTHNFFTIPFHASIACNKFIVYNETILFVGSHKKVELDEFCLPSIKQKLIFCPLSLLSSPLQVLLFLSFIQSKDNKFVINTERFGPGLVQYLRNPEMYLSVVKVVLQTLAALFAIISLL